MSTNAQKLTQVHTERTDVGTSLTADPEDTQVALVVKLVQVGLVDCADTELTLDGGDERRALEERAGEGLEGAGELGLAAWQFVVETDNANVLLSSTLLGLNKAGGAVDTDDQASGDFRIEGSAVSSFLDSVNLLASCRW